MSRIERAAWLAAFMAAWAAYHVAKLIGARLGVRAWVDAWNRVPSGKRDAFRDTLLSEEGIASDGD